jgi:SAM-dependent methyltransferase
MSKAVVVVGVLVGVIVLAPIFLRLALGVRPEGAKSWRDRVQLKYQRLGTFTWMFARFKMRLDPMFRELPEFLGKTHGFKEVLDLGCGHGIAGCALMEWIAEVRVYGVEPNPRRVAAAREAFGMRGVVQKGAAPDFEWAGLPEKLDGAFALDMMHFLDDAAFTLTLWRIRRRLREGAKLFMRVPMAPAGRGSMAWKIDRINRRIRGIPATHRTRVVIEKGIANAGFSVLTVRASGGNPELFWFIATASGGEEERESPR